MTLEEAQMKFAASFAEVFETLQRYDIDTKHPEVILAVKRTRDLADRIKKHLGVDVLKPLAEWCEMMADKRAAPQ